MLVWVYGVVVGGDDDDGSNLSSVKSSGLIVLQFFRTHQVCFRPTMAITNTLAIVETCQGLNVHDVPLDDSGTPLPGPRAGDEGPHGR